MTSTIRPCDTSGGFPLHHTINHGFGNEEWEENLQHSILPTHPGGPSHHFLQRPRQVHFPPEEDCTDTRLFKDRFEVTHDNYHFHSDEVTVTTIKNFVIPEGQHEDKVDPHGYRTFHPQHHPPFNNDEMEGMICKLRSDHHEGHHRCLI